MSAPQKFTPSMPRASVLQRLSRRGSFAMPALVWFGAITGVYFLLQTQPRQLEYTAIATVRSATVTAPATGRVETLVVARHSRVERGELLGRLDGNHLEIRARTVRNRIAELRAEIEREQEMHALRQSQEQLDQDNQQRRFQRDVENARLSALEIIARQEENKIRLEGLKIDLARQDKLITDDLMSEAELIRTRIEVQALGERIKRSEAVLAGRQARVKAVEARLSEFEKRKQVPTADGDRLCGSFKWRIAAQQDELEMIALERKQLEIRATHGGVVVEVLATAGQAVDAGQALVTLLQPKTTEIVAYVPPDVGTALAKGSAVAVQRSSRPNETFQTTVGRIGERVVEVPRQARRIPEVTEWALPVYLAGVPDAAPVPGESLRVRFDD